MREYALDITDLVDLRKFQRRSPYNNEPPITVYLRKDVEAKYVLYIYIYSHNLFCNKFSNNFLHLK